MRSSDADDAVGDEASGPPRRTSEGPRPDRGFTRLWLATGATSLGAQIAQLAVPLLAVVTLDASPGEVGILGAAQWLPFLLVALPLGVLADRRRRRPLLVAAEIVRAVGTVAIVGLGAAGVLALPSLLALVFVIGCGTVLFEVAYQSFLPSIVPRSRLDVANGRLQATEATALVAGPGVAGLLVQLVGAATTLGVTAAGSLLSAILVSRIPEGPAPRRDRPSTVVRELGEGVRFVARDRVLAGLLGYSAISNPFAQWIVLLFLVDGVRRLDLSSGTVGLTLAIGAVGTVLGSAAAPRMARRFGALPVLVGTAVIDPFALFAFPAAEPGWGPSILAGVLGGSFGINGIAVGMSTVVTVTLRQIRTPDALRGRAAAATRMVSYGTIAAGAALGGIAGEALGSRLGLLLGCVGALLTIVWVGAWARGLARAGERLDERPLVRYRRAPVRIRTDRHPPRR